MIALWNRRELTTTWDMGSQAEICRILEEHGIPCTVRAESPQTTNFFGASQRSRTGSFGIRPEYSYQYKIYVHKKDYEQACYVLSLLKNK